MEYPYSAKDNVFALIGIMIVASFIVLNIYCNIIFPIMEERKYIKMEMQRSYSEDEYLYWKKKLKRLYLRHIPIIGRFYKD